MNQDPPNGKDKSFPKVESYIKSSKEDPLHSRPVSRGTIGEEGQLDSYETIYSYDLERVREESKSI
jgi:hypothetical protein